ncbi:MAG: nuclear transport factor 2 family protein [Pedobacter sp.]|nr:MAG: nuclear transport factor 2 family protein [Pedobacter sp.]
MTENKEILRQANKAVTDGDHEGFLAFCTDDIVWRFVGDKTIEGREAIRQYMAVVYQKPPRFEVEQLIEEADFVTALGRISLEDEDGIATNYFY